MPYCCLSGAENGEIRRARGEENSCGSERPERKKTTFVLAVMIRTTVIPSVLRGAAFFGASLVAMRRADDINNIESEGRYLVPELQQASECEHTTNLDPRGHSCIAALCPLVVFRGRPETKNETIRHKKQTK